MRKKNKQPSKPEKETLPDSSEIPDEYIRYIKKLELQRFVLNKIVNSDLAQISTDTLNEPKNLDSN
jgi:hypothetical protein